MAYRVGEKKQTILFPQSIDEYIADDDPVRVYDAFVDSLDFNELGIEINDHQVGNPPYFPKYLVKLIVYGASYGDRSSRKLERATHHNISFIWLMDGLKPDHKTIAKFRRDNRGALKKIIKQCAQLCLKLGLIAGNTLFVDGSKIRANASINNMWSAERCTKYLAKIDQRIEEILKESEEQDEIEKDMDSLVKLGEELADKQKRKEKIMGVLAEIKEGEKTVINSVDPDCVKTKGRQGSHAGYSGEIVVDEKYGFIVNSDAVAESNDLNQFSRQINQANEVLGKPCENACGDAGFANTENLKEPDRQGITVIVPTQKQAGEKEPTEFAKEQFQYDKEKDEYVCPEGQILKFRGLNRRKGHRNYCISKSKICQACRQYGKCTRSKYGRRVIRLNDEEIKEKLEQQYISQKGQEIYKLRKTKVELPFGHIKCNLKVGGFLLRGLAGAKAEMSLWASCFNIARMITLLGVKGAIAQLKA